MDEQKADRWAWWERLKRPFRVVIVDEDTFSELRALRSSGLRLISYLAGIAFALFLLFLLVLSITPLKYYLPGVGNVQNHPEYIELHRRVQDMESAMQAQQTYLDQLQVILGPGEKAAGKAASASPASPSANPAQPVAQAPAPTPELEFLHFVAPLRGEISQHFSTGIRHYGADLLAAKNTPVRATLGGTVIFADWCLETGYTLVLQHSSELISVYKHNATLLKKTGSQVRAGEAIAIIGNTGLLTDGPHLHFEIWYRGKALNPMDYIH